MIRDIYFAFYGEGHAEYTFLVKVVERLLVELLPHAYIQSFHERQPDGNNQTERIVSLAQAGYQLVVFHADADSSDTQTAYDNHFAPALKQLNAEGIDHRLIPVIPVRNTEAWMCADFAAFQEVIGTDLSASDLNFPSQPHEVEKIPDTKSFLKQAISQARGRRRRVKPGEIYEPLAERIRLDILKKVPAFQEFQQQVTVTLKKAGYIA